MPHRCGGRRSGRADGRRLSDDVRSALDGVDAALWQAFGQELGYCGLAIPEEVGGLNLGMTELSLVMEQLGKRLAPMPFFQSSVLAAGVLQYACESAGAQSYLEALASGEQTASLLMDANAGSSEAIFGSVTAKPDGAHYLLSGKVAQLLKISRYALCFCGIAKEPDQHVRKLLQFFGILDQFNGQLGW